MCNNPNLPGEANTAKAFAITVLVFAVIDLLTFAIQGWAAGVASILAIIASSMLVCCAPPSSGPGKGGIFKATGVLALIATIVHLVGAILLIITWMGINTATLSRDSCVATYCSNGAFDTANQCGMPNGCTSESSCETYYDSLCQAGANLLTGIFAIIIWPGIVLSILCFFFELALTITAFKAAGPMESAKGSMMPGNYATQGVVVQPVSGYGQPPPTYGQPAVAYAVP